MTTGFPFSLVILTLYPCFSASAANAVPHRKASSVVVMVMVPMVSPTAPAPMAVATIPPPRREVPAVKGAATRQPMPSSPARIAPPVAACDEVLFFFAFFAKVVA